MYMKIVTGDAAVRHLCLVDQFSSESRTLCGYTITQSQSWKRIRSLGRWWVPAVRGTLL